MSGNELAVRFRSGTFLLRADQLRVRRDPKSSAE